MRILVIGAGATGGYFGGRLLAAGRDVTFLVRERRAAELAQNGLLIRSRLGDANLPAPPTVTADTIRQHFDLILLSCKAYDLAAAIDSFAPAVGPETAILPLLNGMAHLDALTARFGKRCVLGGVCVISATLGAKGEIIHLNEAHQISFGEVDGTASARGPAILSALADARFDTRLSKEIVHDMWEKWVLLCTMAGINCLLRAPVGDIMAAGAGNLTETLLAECTAVAAAHGNAPSEGALTRARGMLLAAGSNFSASMLRDVERGGPVEADHVVGDLLRRGEAVGGNYPLLRIVNAHLKTYETRRKREHDATAART